MADALGLRVHQKYLFVILPQALRIAVPPLVNTFIGLFDLLSTIKLGLTEPAWSGFGVEAYLFAALVYFLFCYGFSRYSRQFENAATASKIRLSSARG
jgi:general L-amino acid transport system permease protein